MPRPAVTYPDPEHLVVDDLTLLLEDEDCTIGIGLPTDWTTDSDPHVQVALDGTPIDDHPIAQRCTMRITVWAHAPTAAKELAQLAHGLLLTLQPYLPLTGLLVVPDPDHDAELASFTVRASVRSVLIP